jgi:ribose transport system permease protein
MFIAFYILFNLTTYGYNTRALGRNEEIAKVAGLNLPEIKQVGFTISGVFLGVASVLYMSSNGQITNPTMFGSMGMKFDAFIGVFLAFFLARYCNLAIGIVIGTFTMITLTNGFVALGVAATMRDILTGVFLLILLCISANQERFKQWRIDRERARLADAKFVLRDQR